MTKQELAFEWAKTIQLALAKACNDKKRLTLDETFNLLSASMNLTIYVRDQANETN